MRVPPTAGYLSVARLALYTPLLVPWAQRQDLYGCVLGVSKYGTTVTTTMATATGKTCKVLYIAILGITWWTITGSRGPICGHCDQKVPVSLLVLVLHVHDNDPWNNARQKEMLLYGLVSIAACKSLNLQVCKVPKAPFQPKTECFSYFNLNHFGII